MFCDTVRRFVARRQVFLLELWFYPVVLSQEGCTLTR